MDTSCDNPVSAAPPCGSPCITHDTIMRDFMFHFCDKTNSLFGVLRGGNAIYNDWLRYRANSAWSCLFSGASIWEGSQLSIIFARILKRYWITVTRSDKRGTKSLGRSRDDRINHHLVVILSMHFFFFIHNVGRLLYHILTVHNPFWPMHDFKTFFFFFKLQKTTLTKAV